MKIFLTIWFQERCPCNFSLSFSNLFRILCFECKCRKVSILSYDVSFLWYKQMKAFCLCRDNILYLSRMFFGDKKGNCKKLYMNLPTRIVNQCILKKLQMQLIYIRAIFLYRARRTRRFSFSVRHVYYVCCSVGILFMYDLSVSLIVQRERIMQSTFQAVLSLKCSLGKHRYMVNADLECSFTNKDTRITSSIGNKE